MRTSLSAKSYKEKHILVNKKALNVVTDIVVER